MQLKKLQLFTQNAETVMLKNLWRHKFSASAAEIKCVHSSL